MVEVTVARWKSASSTSTSHQCLSPDPSPCLCTGGRLRSLEPSPDGRHCAVLYCYGVPPVPPDGGGWSQGALYGVAVYDLKTGMQQAHPVRDSLLPCRIRWAGQRLSIAWHARSGESSVPTSVSVCQHLC